MKLEEFIALASKKHRGLNKDLLRAVAKRLRGLRHEAHYDQAEWIERTHCGTACCIAGWAVREAGATPVQALEIQEEYLNGGIAQTAQNLLGLTGKQVGKLFDPEGDEWPTEFRNRFHDAIRKASKERPSRVVAEMLDAIADGKVKL